MATQEGFEAESFISGEKIPFRQFFSGKFADPAPPPSGKFHYFSIIFENFPCLNNFLFSMLTTILIFNLT